jgi:hypothetical protein
MLKDEVQIAYRQFRYKIKEEDKRYKDNLRNLLINYKSEVKRIKENYKNMEKENKGKV